MAEMKELSAEIKELDAKLTEIEKKLKDTLLGIPNTPYKDVQTGEDDSDNLELRKNSMSREISALSPRLTGI